MTFVGKLLVIINLLMSFCFMAFAVSVYTARQDVEAKQAKLTQDLADAKQDKQNAETEMQATQKKLSDLEAAAKSDREAAQQQITNLEENNARLNDAVKEAQNDAARAATAMQTATKEQQQRKQEVDDLRSTRDALLKEKSELVSTKTKLQDQLSQTTNELEILTGRAQEMETKLQQYAGYIQQFKGVLPTEAELETAGELPPVPEVEGAVVAVDQTGRFVQLSIGEDSGLMEGHELEVWRTSPQPKYIGKIRVFSTEATTSVANPISQVGLIRKNDRVGPRVIPAR